MFSIAPVCFHNRVYPIQEELTSPDVISISLTHEAGRAAPPTLVVADEKRRCNQRLPNHIQWPPVQRSWVDRELPIVAGIKLWTLRLEPELADGRRRLLWQRRKRLPKELVRNVERVFAEVSNDHNEHIKRLLVIHIAVQGSLLTELRIERIHVGVQGPNLLQSVHELRQRRHHRQLEHPRIVDEARRVQQQLAVSIDQRLEWIEQQPQPKY